MAPTEKGQDDNFKTHIMSNSNSQPKSRFSDMSTDVTPVPTHGEILEKVEEVKKCLANGDDMLLHRYLTRLQYRERDLSIYGIIHVHVQHMIHDLIRILDDKNMICDDDDLKKGKLSEKQMYKAEHLQSLLGSWPDEYGFQRIDEIHEEWCKDEVEEKIKRNDPYWAVDPI